jgi:ABC-2 type transport system permease protein
MRALILKEIRGFFSSLIGYVVVLAFLLMVGLFLWVFPGPWNVMSVGIASMDPFFTLAPWVMIFLVPAITMRMFAEERRSGTLELLLTRPLLEWQIVLAKFIGALALIAMSLLPTFAFVWVIGELGSPVWNIDLGGVWGSYVGLFMLASSMAAIGLFVSSMTRQPLIAFLASMLLSTLCFICFTALGNFSILGSWDYLFEQIGLEAHYRALSKGFIDTRDIAYFIFVDVLFLQLARFVLALSRGRVGREMVRLTIVIATAVVVLFASQIKHTSFDLTAEKRHTLTEGSAMLLDEIIEKEKQVVITCYLSGEYPASWKRLEIAIREKLEEFAGASNGHLRFQFVDIYESGDRQTIGQNEERLQELGMSFTRIGHESGGSMTFQNVWPAALITCNGKEIPVQFFSSEIPEPSDLMIQGSINSIEYQISSSIRRSLFSIKPQIAFIEGHGELQEVELGDFILSLEEDYGVTRVKLDGKLHILAERLKGMRYRTNRFDLAIIAKPDSMFSKYDLLILDQFLMAGGRILWMVDALRADLDSLRGTGTTMTTTVGLGIRDQLADYGVQINNNLVVDENCALIELDAGPRGNQRNVQLFNWYFDPITIPALSSHPIVTNLDPIHFNFVSSLDTLETDEDVQKTILLSSSERSRVYRAPVRVSTSIVELKPDYFNKNTAPNSIFAVLLEGSFNSHFTDKLPPVLIDDPDFAFRATGKQSAMVVISDGDVCRNEIINTQEGIRFFPLGYDKYTGKVKYDNKEFLRNVVNHLLDESSMISVRSRSITLRSLDSDKIINEKLYWQYIALAIPLSLVICLALIVLKFRKIKYGKK